MQNKKVAVIGCGAMGSVITEVVRQSGYEVIVREADRVLLEKGLECVKASFEKLVKKQALTQEARDAALK
jgi:3-hydroxybutyryl-CoA dehydrogenase